MTVTQTAPDREPSQAAYRYGSEPRSGFGDHEKARYWAAVFLGDGITAGQMRDGIHPDDSLLNELVDAMDELADSVGGGH